MNRGSRQIMGAERAFVGALPTPPDEEREAEHAPPAPLEDAPMKHTVEEAWTHARWAAQVMAAGEVRAHGYKRGCP